jgi:hypothetical protein
MRIACWTALFSCFGGLAVIHLLYRRTNISRDHAGTITNAAFDHRRTTATHVDPTARLVTHRCYDLSRGFKLWSGPLDQTGLTAV